MTMLSIAPILFFSASSFSSAWSHAFGTSSLLVAKPIRKTHSPMPPRSLSLSSLALLRGGQQGEHKYGTEVEGPYTQDSEDVLYSSSAAVTNDSNSREKENGSKSAQSFSTLTSVAVVAPLSSLASFYTHQLKTRPIQTKSVTAGIIFGLSDYFAQTIQRGDGGDGIEKKTAIVQSRILTNFIVGLVIFGPAANWWYSTMFKLWPSTALLPTLIKAFLGQLLFGPAFTCIFFAAGMIRMNTFSFVNWINKIKQDLPSVAASGAGFWMPVSVISYKFIPEHWIPLFTNACSFVWTIYLSLVSNRRSKE